MHGENLPARPQDAMDLGQQRLLVADAFQRIDRHEHVERRIAKRQFIYESLADELGIRAARPCQLNGFPHCIVSHQVRPGTDRRGKRLQEPAASTPEIEHPMAAAPVEIQGIQRLREDRGFHMHSRSTAAEPACGRRAGTIIPNLPVTPATAEARARPAPQTAPLAQAKASRSCIATTPATCISERRCRRWRSSAPA